MVPPLYWRACILVWGVFLAIALIYFATELWRCIKIPERLRMMKRFLISVFGCAICSFALSISSGYFLFFASEDDGNGNSDYFGWRVATGCFEITIFILFTIAVFPNEIIAFVRLPSFTSSR